MPEFHRKQKARREKRRRGDTPQSLDDTLLNDTDAEAIRQLIQHPAEAPMSPRTALQLQQLAGNQAAAGLLDQHQREAAAHNLAALPDNVVQGVLRVPTVREQDAYDCGLYSIWMAIEAVAGTAMPDVIHRLMDRAQELTGDLGGLFSFSNLEKIVRAVGYEATRVPFTGQLDFVEKLRQHDGDAVLIAYDCLVADPGSEELAGMGSGDRAHWSVISHFNEEKQILTVANPWGKKQYYRVTDIFGANIDLSDESFDWEKFARGQDEEETTRRFFELQAAKYGQDPEAVRLRAKQALDLGGYFVTIA